MTPAAIVTTSHLATAGVLAHKRTRAGFRPGVGDEIPWMDTAGHAGMQSSR